jgi:hypothetical protein
MTEEICLVKVHARANMSWWQFWNWAEPEDDVDDLVDQVSEAVESAKEGDVSGMKEVRDSARALSAKYDKGSKSMESDLDD